MFYWDEKIRRGIPLTQFDYQMIEEFDLAVERFMRGQMSNDEELHFKNELQRSEVKRARARTIALVVSEMKQFRLEEDKKIIDSMLPACKECLEEDGLLFRDDDEGCDDDDNDEEGSDEEGDEKPEK